MTGELSGRESVPAIGRALTDDSHPGSNRPWPVGIP